MSAPWIQLEKLAAPEPPSAWQARPRLQAAAEAAPACLLLGGPGAGKTLGLLALLAPGGLTLWYSLDAEDADPTCFFQHLLAGMRVTIPDFGAPLDAWLAEPDPRPERLWRGFFGAIAAYAPPTVTIVLDDFHHLDPAWARALGASLERLPPRTRVLLASRRTPPIPLARLRAAGKLAVLGTEALRFDAGEEAAYLRARAGGEPPTAWVRRAARLDGWPLGLGLVAASPAGWGDEAPDDIAAFVAEELVRVQPPAVQALMRQAAWLDSLDAGTLAAVFPEAADVAGALAHLEAEQLVLRLEGGQGLRFPAYLREHLLAEVARATPPAVRAGWHRQAAAHHAAAGRPDLALPHHLGLGDLEAAYAAAREAHGELLLAGRFRVLARWLDAFPADFAEHRGHLHLWRGEVLGRGGDSARALGAYARAAACFEAEGNPAALLRALARQASLLAMAGQDERLREVLERAGALAAAGEDIDRADLLLVRALVADLQGDSAAMRACNEAVLALADPGAAVASARWVAHVNLFTYHLHAGDLAAAGEHVDAANAIAERQRLAAYGLFGAFLRAHLDLTRGDLAAAGAFLRRLPPGWTDTLEWQDLGNAWTVLGHFHRLGGEFAEAERALNRAIGIFERGDHPVGRLVPLEQLAWLAIQRGRPAQAIARCDEAPADAENVYALAVAVARARAQHLTGDLAGALAAWERLLPALEACGAGFLRVRAGLYAAATAARTGTARGWLAEARAAIAARGYDFLLEADPELEPPTPAPAPAAPGDAGLALRCFGPFEVRVDGRLVDQWPRRKARRLLAALALAPDGEPQGTLAAVLEETGPQAGSRVRTCLATLRKALEPTLDRGEDSRYVLASRDAYRLAAVASIDTAAFDAAEAEGLQLATSDPAAAAAAFTRALELYRGHLLDEPQFGDAFDFPRRAYMRRALAALDFLQRYHASIGDLSHAEAALRRAIALAPCEEEPCLAMVRFLVATGRADRARQAYWDYRKALQHQLGLAPTPEFEAAYAAAARPPLPR